MTLENVSPDATPAAAPSAPVAAPSAPAAEAPASSSDMGETIRSAFRKLNGAQAEGIKDFAAPAENTAAEPAENEPMVDDVETQATDERPRGPDGKFIKAGETTVDPATEVTTQDAEPEAPVAEEPTKVGEIDISKPPSSLNAAEKAEYAKASPTLRAAFHRREADFHKGLAESREMATVGQIMDKEIRPYEAMIRAANLTPQLVVRDLLNTAYQLRTGTPDTKLQVVLDVAKHYGVDLSNLQVRAEELAANAPPPPDPRVMELENKIQGLAKTLEEQKTAAEQAEYQAQQLEVQKFAANPANKHYEAVKLDMAALLQNGRASDLQDAYNKATWGHPAVRESLLAEQREADRKRAAERAAAAKKAASVNVAPRGTPPPAPVVGTDMSDTIRAALKKMQGG